ELTQFRLCLFTRIDFQFEVLNGLYRSIRRRRKSPHALEQPHVLGVESAKIIVTDRPNRTDRFAVNVKRNKQSFVGKRHRRAQIWIASFPMREQHWAIVVEHIAAWAEIARGSAADVRLPGASDTCPVEPLVIFRQQT